MSESIVRVAAAADIPTLVLHRRAMFEEMGLRDGAPFSDETLDRVDRAYAALLPDALGVTQFGFVVDGPAGALPVASAMLWFAPWQPSPRVPNGSMAYVHGVWTEPAHRGHGYAHMLIEAIIAHARARGYLRVVLHASEAGRSIYEKLGFVAGSEMVLSFT